MEFGFFLGMNLVVNQQENFTCKLFRKPTDFEINISTFHG